MRPCVAALLSPLERNNKPFPEVAVKQSLHDSVLIMTMAWSSSCSSAEERNPCVAVKSWIPMLLFVVKERTLNMLQECWPHVVHIRARYETFTLWASSVLFYCSLAMAPLPFSGALVSAESHANVYLGGYIER